MTKYLAFSIRKIFYFFIFNNNGIIINIYHYNLLKYKQGRRLKHLPDLILITHLRFQTWTNNKFHFEIRKNNVLNEYITAHCKCSHVDNNHYVKPSQCLFQLEPRTGAIVNLHFTSWCKRLTARIASVNEKPLHSDKTSGKHFRPVKHTHAFFGLTVANLSKCQWLQF